jgi:hypothetical protein
MQLTRRQFLTLAAGLALAPPSTVHAEIQRRHGTYAVEVGLLYGTLSLGLAGTVDEVIDRTAGRYEVRLAGEGAGISNRVESSGRLLGSRWVPTRGTAWFQVRGRESRSEIVYDHARRLIDYHFRGETFFLRRLRVVDDTLAMPEGLEVDDVMSASLNYGEGLWKAGADGGMRTHIVRRRRREAEGPDDVDPDAGAELAPFVLQVAVDRATGKPVAEFDMTRFSSWARPGHPGRVVFGANRRPELVTSALMLGTSITVRLRDG